MTLTTDLHNYLNEEREQLDFSELRDSLKDVLQGFNEDSTQNIEQLSLDFTDSIQRAINEVNKSLVNFLCFSSVSGIRFSI